jgi:hypothetical protein
MLQAISQSQQVHEVNYKLTEVCYCNIQGVDFLIIILAQMHMGPHAVCLYKKLISFIGSMVLL